MSTGSFVGGYIMEKHGGSQTFRMFGIGALILFLCHVTIQLVLDKTSRGKKNAGDHVSKNLQLGDQRSNYEDNDGGGDGGHKLGTNLSGGNTIKNNLLLVNGGGDRIDEFKEIDLKN